MKAKIIIVKLNTVVRRGNEFIGPVEIESVKVEANGRTGESFRPEIQRRFDTDLKGIAGYVLVAYRGKLYQCERDNVDPHKPYIRHVIRYHPLAVHFI